MSWGILLLVQVGQDTTADLDLERQCGAIALQCVFAHHGKNVSVAAVIRELPGDGKDASLQELKTVAERNGFHCVGLRWENLPSVSAPPAIIPVASQKGRLHFVAVTEWQGSTVLLHDSGRTGQYSIDALRRAGWDGTALHISTSSAAISSLQPHWWSYPKGRWIACSVLYALSALIVLSRKQSLNRRNS